MANTKKDIEMENQETVQTLAEGDVLALVEKMVAAALAKREAELAEREAELAAREAQQASAAPASAYTPPANDPWQEKREVFLPYAPKGDEQFVFVSVNGRKYQVPRGRSVTLPLPLYERIQIMQEAEIKTMDYVNSLPTEAYPSEAVRLA